MAVSIPRRGNEDPVPAFADAHLELFQSLVGAMRTAPEELLPLVEALFQSLVGAMRTRPATSAARPT